MTDNFKAQYGQDAFISKLFNNKKNGFFVDIGAYDGVKYSNTWYLEKALLWKGICVEPNPGPFEKLKRNRNANKVNCGVSDKKSESPFLSLTCSGEMLSGFIDGFDQKHWRRINEFIKLKGAQKNLIAVDVMTLQEILDIHHISKVDYCSIDVEGGDLAVLKSVDFSRTYIQVLSIENN